MKRIRSVPVTDPGKAQNNLLYYQDQLFVPNNMELISQFMRMHHDDPLAGDFGKEKTLSLLQRKYYWSSMVTAVENYVKSCLVCQTSK